MLVWLDGAGAVTLKLFLCEPCGRLTFLLDMKWPSPLKDRSSRSTCALPWVAAPFSSCPASAQPAAQVRSVPKPGA